MKQQPNLQRIKPFLLLLASDQGGEVIAAAHAMVRTLKATGHDLHDLFQLLNSANTPAPKPKEQPREERPKEAAPIWQTMAERVLARHPDCGCLNHREREFEEH